MTQGLMGLKAGISNKEITYMNNWYYYLNLFVSKRLNNIYRFSTFKNKWNTFLNLGAYIIIY